MMLTRRTRRLSQFGLITLAVCIAGSVMLSLADGVLRASLAEHMMVSIWVTDLRFLLEQGILAATLFWAAASFLETRVVLTVGFDRIDAAAMAVRGPDEVNIVWVGRRYSSRLEAEAVVAALEARLQDATR